MVNFIILILLYSIFWPIAKLSVSQQVKKESEKDLVCFLNTIAIFFQIDKLHSLYFIYISLIFNSNNQRWFREKQ